MRDAIFIALIDFKSDKNGRRRRYGAGIKFMQRRK